MLHLSPERIAALVDEPATHDERSHFESCSRCRADFVALRRLVDAAASERDRPIAPLVPWQQLAGALRAEGLLGEQRNGVHVNAAAVDVRPISSAPSRVIAASLGGDVRIAQRRPRLRAAGMAAAAALLITIGAVGGRWTSNVDARATVAVAPGIPEIAAVQRGVPTVEVSNVSQFRSADEARATLQSAEEAYGGALLWLAAHDSALSPRQPNGADAAVARYRKRLEILDAAMASARRAVYEAPDDQVMNRYYLATLGAREVTLRRLTTVLPASQQVLEY